MVSKAVYLGSALASSLPGVLGILQVVVPQLQNAVADHAYLTFDATGLPAVLQLAPVDCADGHGADVDAPARKAQWRISSSTIPVSAAVK